MIRLEEAVQDTITLLSGSQESVWSHLAPNEIIRILEDELRKADEDQPFDLETIALLYAPTGDVQEISIANAWNDKYLEIAQIVEMYTERKVGKQ